MLKVQDQALADGGDTRLYSTCNELCHTRGCKKALVDSDATKLCLDYRIIYSFQCRTRGYLNAYCWSWWPFCGTVSGKGIKIIIIKFNK